VTSSRSGSKIIMLDCSGPLRSSARWLLLFLLASGSSDGLLKEAGLQWLIENGYLKPDVQNKKEEVSNRRPRSDRCLWHAKIETEIPAIQIIDLFKRHYNAAASKSHDYLTWTDARLRGWLRHHGIPVELSTRREELIQRVRENYVSTQGSLEGLLHSVQEWVYGGVEIAEEKVRDRMSREADINAG
jgi:hypothetical protein